MAKTLSHKNFFIREYRNGDFTEVKHLWSLTEMDNPERGDDEKTIKDTIKLGGSMLILEEKKQAESAEHHG